MDIRKLTPQISVSPQISVDDVAHLAEQGFHTIINNRPDGESADQPSSAEIEQAAKTAGLHYAYIPIIPGQMNENIADEFAQVLDKSPGPILAYCRSGTRSASFWAIGATAHTSPEHILAATHAAGYDLSMMRPLLEKRAAETLKEKTKMPPSQSVDSYDVIVVGGGAGGIATVASLQRRRQGLKIAIIEPSEEHYYQPGWTLVGGGIFSKNETIRTMASVMPKDVTWIKAAVTAFKPDADRVVLDDGSELSYASLVASPGLKLDWDKVKGLRETLGKNGVTSNYMRDLAPYTWELVQGLKNGTAIFTQPPMPIKCAGAPQKAMYLSCDHWTRANTLSQIKVEFCNAGGVLFGVADYVPALMEYVKKYGIALGFFHNLTAVDGANKTATFDIIKDGKVVDTVQKKFDMLHVCPPQTAPDFVRNSPLANEAGWIDVNQETLQHTRFSNVFSLGDACSAPNAKTAAAVRKQAPIVAENLLAFMDKQALPSGYDGYGSCPLTVERGKIVLAEFGYGGKLLPTFPTWLVAGKKPTRLAWFLKEKMLPFIYWNMMLKGSEYLAEPHPRSTSDKS